MAKSKTYMIRGIKFKKKTDSLMMKIFAFLLKPFAPGFMTDFWTTIGTTIYVPDAAEVDTSTEDQFYTRFRSIILHEGQHIADFKRYHVWFILTYLLPPLLFAYGRFYWERRAYFLQLIMYAGNLT